MHYEEGTATKSLECFKKMGGWVRGIGFELTRNMGKNDVIKVMKWKDWETFITSILESKTDCS